jgi:hypothetical protein
MQQFKRASHKWHTNNVRSGRMSKIESEGEGEREKGRGISKKKIK